MQTGLKDLDEKFKKISLDQQALDYQLELGAVPKSLYNHWTGIFSARKESVLRLIKIELEKMVV